MRVYLDNAATTQVDERVIQAMLPYMSEHYGNPSSIHYFGKKPKVLLEDARETIADFIGAKPKEIFFTSGGTEAINTAIKCSLREKRNHIITTTIEHPAVLESVKYMKEKYRAKVTFIKPERSGRIDNEKIFESITDETALICLMHSNNETGIINDVSGIGKTAMEKGILFLSDTVQSIGKTKIDVNELNVNFATSSAHKIYGPKGIGFLYVKSGTPFQKFLHGGGQERNMRASTENIPMISAYKKAIEIIKENFEKEILHYKTLTTALKKILFDEFGYAINFNTPEENSLPNILNVRFDNNKLKFDSDMIIMNMDLKGIAVSGGSACSSGSLKPSAVLMELGFSEDEAKSSVRISVGRFNTLEDVEFFINKLNEIFK